jgi:excisionase family DNA binding protein
VSAPDDVALLGNSQVADLFNVYPQTVTRWGASGRLLTLRTIGGHYKFFEAEVDALLRGEPRSSARKLAEAEKARLTGGLP